MTEPAEFLRRWSRRKREVAEGRTIDEGPATASDENKATAEPAAAPLESAEPGGEAEFDIASLPSIDSIGPETDITVFMKPGVPSSLRHAALRRVWVNDPAIRDFRAPQEMDWDFNAGEVAGFGEIGPDIDVKKMAARILGDKSAEEVAQGEKLTPNDTANLSGTAKSDDSNDVLPVIDDVKPATDVAMLQSEENTAPQQKQSAETPLPPRKHGSALPH